MRWLSFLNLVLVSLLFLIGIFFFTRFASREEIPLFQPRIDMKEIPPSPFASSEDENWCEGALALKWVPPQMLLPDLRGELQYFGQNGRPDAYFKGSRSFHLGLKSSGESRVIRPGERIYLVYQGDYPKFIDPSFYREPATHSQRPLWGDVSTPKKGSYLFSPGNQPTPLWLEINSSAQDLLSLNVNMIDEKGTFVCTPSQFRQISLHSQEFPKTLTTGQQLGKYRLDSTLFVRQKARWIGADRFLELHGGEEFAHAIGRERIDFLDAEIPYCCFVKENDVLIWKEERWEMPKKGETTEGFFLLFMKKIDDKLMNFELWDPQGRGKINLSLVRAMDHHKAPDMSQELKFVGAKTWAQFIVECRNGDRLTLKPQDWLVLTQDGWKKLDSPELIDFYVEGQLSGPLFILEKMTKKNGRQTLIGHLFNASRTEVEEIELQSASSPSLANLCRTFPATPPIIIHLEGSEE